MNFSPKVTTAKLHAASQAHAHLPTGPSSEEGNCGLNSPKEGVFTMALNARIREVGGTPIEAITQ